MNCAVANLTQYSCTHEELMATNFPITSPFHLSNTNRDRCAGKTNNCKLYALRLTFGKMWPFYCRVM